LAGIKHTCNPKVKQFSIQYFKGEKAGSKRVGFFVVFYFALPFQSEGYIMLIGYTIMFIVIGTNEYVPNWLNIVVYLNGYGWQCRKLSGKYKIQVMYFVYRLC